MPDRRPALAQSYVHAAEIVTGVRPDQLDKPTPCTEYDVATLVDHLVFAGRRAAELGRGSTIAEQTRVPLVSAADELGRARADAESAWANDERLATTVDMPWGETYTGAYLIDMYVAELAAHTWDLAAATGQLGRLPTGFATEALESARAMLRPEYRDAMGKGNPFGAETPAPAGATDWERFAAFMGRDPLAWESLELPQRG